MLLKQAEQDDLEGLVDTYGVPGVLEALANICHEKADHLVHAWQDRHAAAIWTRAAKAVEAFANRTVVLETLP